MWKVLLVFIPIILAATGLYWLAKDADVDQSKRYVTAAAQRGHLRETVSATGTVKAVVTVEVGSQISGLIDRLYVDFNEQVKEGQALAQLDQETFVAKLAEARAALQMAKAQVNIRLDDVEHAQIGIRDAKVQIPVLQARLEKAQADHAAADANFQRSSKLLKQALASVKAHDEAKARRAVAAAAIREAEAIVAAQKEKIDTAEADLARARSELGNATANVAKMQALMKVAEVNLQRATIRSPIDGVVIKRNVERGQTVAASLEAPTLFTIAQDLREMQVDARIDETDIGKMKIGQRARFTVDAFPGRNFEGEVLQIRKAPELRQNVVTYTVVIRTQNPQLVLLPGMTAALEIIVMESEELLKIPNAALSFSLSRPPRAVNASRMVDKNLRQPAEAVVWKLDDKGMPSPASLRLGHRDASSVEVLDGPLREGDQVIVREISKASDRRLFGIRIGF